MKKSNKESFRETVANAFIRSIEADPLHWRKEWSYSGPDCPCNAVKGTNYRGINVLYLSFVAHEKGYDDPRWATFKQAQEKGWRIKAGEKGAKVEYWMPFDNETKKCITWHEYNNKTDNGRIHLTYKDEYGNKIEKYSIRAKYFTVFNAEQIEGIPELKVELNPDIQKSEVVERVSKGMGVSIIEKSGNRAYYSPDADEIHLPLKEQFESDNAYQSTALHELGHATGHKSRLGRDHTGRFGDENYAFEELVAEMSSAFMGEYFEVEPSEAELENHKAYVQNWASRIKKDNNYLFKAIKQAEKAADYMIDAGDLEILRSERVENMKAEAEAEKALNAMEALNGADGVRAFGSIEEIAKAEDAVQTLISQEEEELEM